MPGGPQPFDHDTRLQRGLAVAGKIRAHFGEKVRALGLYGSLARGIDGPYSDIEIFCVLTGSGIDRTLEWSEGAWKAEVNLFSEDVIFQRAAEVDVDWALSQGAVTEVQAIYDPEGIFLRLREAALFHPKEVFRRAIREVIVGEIYERVGKIRNACARGYPHCLPYWAAELVRFGALLIGLDNRTLYTTGSLILEESLALPARPAGYDALCQMLMAGDLAQNNRICAAADAFWDGVERWAAERGIVIEETLDELLRKNEFSS